MESEDGEEALNRMIEGDVVRVEYLFTEERIDEVVDVLKSNAGVLVGFEDVIGRFLLLWVEGDGVPLTIVLSLSKHEERELDAFVDVLDDGVFLLRAIRILLLRWDLRVIEWWRDRSGVTVVDARGAA